jgi:dipeptidase D
MDSFRAAAHSSLATVREMLAPTDPGADVNVSVGDPAAADAWTEEATAALLDVVALVPSGPLAMSPGFEGVVETSTSLSEAATDGDDLVLHSLMRSANDAAVPELIATFEAIARLANGRLEVDHNHGGWLPDLDSPVLVVARRIYEERFGAEPKVTAIHGGLEPAVIGGIVPGLDMIAIGPLIEGMHAPGERLNAPSVERFWELASGLVDELSRGG